MLFALDPVLLGCQGASGVKGVRRGGSGQPGEQGRSAHPEAPRSTHRNADTFPPRESVGVAPTRVARGPGRAKIRPRRATTPEATPQNTPPSSPLQPDRPAPKPPACRPSIRRTPDSPSGRHRGRPCASSRRRRSGFRLWRCPGRPTPPRPPRTETGPGLGFGRHAVLGLVDSGVQRTCSVRRASVRARAPGRYLGGRGTRWARRPRRGPRSGEHIARFFCQRFS